MSDYMQGFVTGCLTVGVGNFVINLLMAWFLLREINRYR